MIETESEEDSLSRERENESERMKRTKCNFLRKISNMNNNDDLLFMKTAEKKILHRSNFFLDF